jgi:hypothetical protein
MILDNKPYNIYRPDIIRCISLTYRLMDLPIKIDLMQYALRSIEDPLFVTGEKHL